mgnify:FL=1|tara:strand:+ start:837 stop:1256 length:420 start_codon:yes stop_codon:yes gene_type:complete
MKLLGLDWGSKRIGMAISTNSTGIALPLHTLSRTSWTNDVSTIKNIIETHNVSMIIIGLPLLLSGKLGQQALDIKNAVTNLQTEIEIPINLFDERLTTQQSYKILKETQTKNSKIDEKIDEVSACLILQSYIDSNHNEV